MSSIVCGQPIKSRPGKTCTNLASHYVVGGQSCGKHMSFLVGKETSNYQSTPPPPPLMEPFIPYECGICMGECRSVKTSLVTSCKHKFHKTCMLKWEKSCHRVFNCPMCRKELPRTVPRPPSQISTQLELFIRSLRENLTDGQSLQTLQRLENVMNSQGSETAETIVYNVMRELENRRVVAGSIVV